MHQAWGYTCHLCGHEGAGEADHLDALALHPDQPVDWTRLRPAHGSNYPCLVCPPTHEGKPRCCNQERGIKPLHSTFKPAHDWGL
jgi:hypothetical protein